MTIALAKAKRLQIEQPPTGSLKQFQPQNDLKICQYVDILTSKGVDWGLIGPKEPERIWSRHVLNCASIESLIPIGAKVADIGSGAGLPGIVLALAREDLQLTLIEPLERRAKFLTETVDALGIADRVAIWRGRAEANSDSYDVVTARAVARLPKLLGWITGLVHDGSKIVALKGESAAEELREADKQLKKLSWRGSVVQLKPLANLDPTWAIVIETA